MTEREKNSGTGQLQHFDLIQSEENKDNKRGENLDEETGMYF